MTPTLVARAPKPLPALALAQRATHTLRRKATSLTTARPTRQLHLVRRVTVTMAPVTGQVTVEVTAAVQMQLTAGVTTKVTAVGMETGMMEVTTAVATATDTVVAKETGMATATEEVIDMETTGHLTLATIMPGVFL